MSAKILQDIFVRCTNILNLKFTIAGFSVSLMSFMMFGIVAYILARVIFQLFDN